MDFREQQQEVDRNFDFFQRHVNLWMSDHRDQYALLRDAAVVNFFPSLRAAREAGDAAFEDGRYSIQQVTVEPIDLGIFSHAGH